MWFSNPAQCRTLLRDHQSASQRGIDHLLVAAAKFIGAKPPLRVPNWLARLVAGEMAVGMMTQGRGFSNAKTKRELGWELTYRSWHEGFRKELT